MACQGQDILRSEVKINAFEKVSVASENDADVREGHIVGRAINACRNLVNQPPNILYIPKRSLKVRLKSVSPAGFDVEVWDEVRLASEECRTLLAVAQGSDRPPRMLTMKYNGADETSPTLGLVGKGVTFDSGGYSLKPSDGMFDMKCDMGGAATVIGAMQAIAELKLPVKRYRVLRSGRKPCEWQCL